MSHRYVELHARSAFSFLEGSSGPEDLVEICGRFGMPAIAKPLDLEDFLQIGHLVKELLLRSTARLGVVGSGSHTAGGKLVG